MGLCQSSNDPSKASDRFYSTQLQQEAISNRHVKKLLLLGPGNSGKSTFFKQLCSIYAGGFKDSLHADIKRAIHDCIITQMKAIIVQCEGIQMRIIRKGTSSRQCNHCFITHTNLNNQIAAYIKTLWSDQQIRDAFEHRTHLGIVDSCPHFFESIDRINDANFEPTDEDILLVRTPTSGCVKQAFTMRETDFMIFDVGGQRSERNKWIHCFESVTAVLFVASLSCYDQALYELEHVNGMHEALNLFDEIINSRWFRRTSMILFLNKSDLFKKKIKTKSLKVCFPEYSGADGSVKEGVMYVKEQFMKLNQNRKGRQVYSHVTCATNKNDVEKVFNDVQHIVVNSSLQRGGLL